MYLVTICASAFAFGFIGSVPLAGPIAVMVLARATLRRFGEALRIALGASVAEGLYAGGAFWGFSRLSSRSDLVVPISRAAATVIFLALGVRFVFWRPKEESDRRENKAGTALLGFTISALNPTLFVTWSAAAAFVQSGHDQGSVRTQLDAIPFGVVAAAGIGSWFLVLVTLLRRYEGHVPKNALSWSVRALGLCLVALGVWSGVRLEAWWATGQRPPTHDGAASDP